MFKVLDAHRVSKRSMGDMMTAERMEEWVQSYALYRIDIQWRGPQSIEFLLRRQQHEYLVLWDLFERQAGGFSIIDGDASSAQRIKVILEELGSNSFAL